MEQASTAQPRVVPVDVLVSYGAFFLQDVGHFRPVQSVAKRLGDDLVATGPGGAAFASAAPDHVASVRLEVWNEAPRDDTKEWEVSAERVLCCDSGRVQFWTTDSGPASEVIDLDGPGYYRLRVACRGRDAARARFEEYMFSGIEQWRLQLWKTGPLDHEPQIGPRRGRRLSTA